MIVQMTSALVLWANVAGTAPFDFRKVDDRVDHHAEHRDGDRHADPEDQHVQVVDLAAQLGDADRAC